MANLNSDMKLVDQVVSELIQRASQRKDAVGRSNPRVTRSYIHAMLPELKQSREFGQLTPVEKSFVMQLINQQLKVKR